MAESLNTTILPRRTLLAGAAALAALPILSKPTQADPVFAEKLATFWKARQAMQEAYAITDERLAAIGPCPPIPSELFVTFSHPDKAGIAAPPEGGWTVADLTAIAKCHYHCRSAPWIYFLPSNHPVCWKAAELLPIRVAYDMTCKEWREKVRAVEASTRPHLIEQDRAAEAVIRHPVFTLAEVRAKMMVADTVYLFEHDDADEFRDLILKDALATAEAAHA